MSATVPVWIVAGGCAVCILPGSQLNTQVHWTQATRCGLAMVLLTIASYSYGSYVGRYLQLISMLFKRGGYSSVTGHVLLETICPTLQNLDYFRDKRRKHRKSVHVGTRTWFIGLMLHRCYQLATGAAAQNPLVLRI